MVDVPVDEPAVGLPELQSFLARLPADLEKLQPAARDRWAREAQSLRKAAYRTVSPAISDLADALIEPSPDLVKALGEHGLTGANLRYKLFILHRARQRIAARDWLRRVPFFRSFWGRALRDYLAVLEVLFDSISNAFKAAGYDLAAGGDMIKEFLAFCRWLYEMFQRG